MKTPEEQADRIVEKWCQISGLSHLKSVIAAALREKDGRIKKLEGYLERANWRRCDIAACNCNGYHNWNPSRSEIEEPLKERIEELERERDHWKANHDNQVALKAAIAQRPDLKERAELVQGLTKRIQELEKGLEPFAQQASSVDTSYPDNTAIETKLGWMRRAAELLKKP